MQGDTIDIVSIDGHNLTGCIVMTRCQFKIEYINGERSFIHFGSSGVGLDSCATG